MAPGLGDGSVTCDTDPATCEDRSHIAPVACSDGMSEMRLHVNVHIRLSARTSYEPVPARRLSFRIGMAQPHSASNVSLSRILAIPAFALGRFFFTDLLQLRLIRFVELIEVGMAREVRAKRAIFMGEGHRPCEIGREDKVIG